MTNARTRFLSLAVLLTLVLVSCSDGGGILVVCGNGMLESGEECDDGNNDPGDGCDASCHMETQLNLTGEYDVSVDVSLDTCGFGQAPGSTPMRVVDLSQVSVDIPADGECNPKTFDRNFDTLTLIESFDTQIGPCTVRVDVSTELTFLADGSVTGSEVNNLQAVGGLCTSLTLPCTLQLQLTGTTCAGCFACTAPATGGPAPRLGPVGNVLRVGGLRR